VILDFDRAATTPLLPAVREAMLPWWGALGANAAAVHAGGRAARRAVEDARERIAAAVAAEPDEVILTSGATEADNLALQGAVAHRPGAHLIVSRGEHPAVLRAAERLQRRGYDVTFLPLDADGALDPAAVAAALRPDTALVAAMLVNNETGARSDLPAIARLLRSHGALLLCDAVQGLGDLDVAEATAEADYVVLSAHKIGGPQGIGALIVRRDRQRDTPLEPQLLGGVQERGRRGGTTPVALAVGFGVAAAHASDWRPRAAQVAAVRDRFEQAALAIAGVEPSLPRSAPRGGKHAHLVVPALAGDGETLLINLDSLGVWASLGSACAAGSLEPSPVLLAMGWSRERARSAIRFSFGPDHTLADAAAGAERFALACARSLAGR
jgi:cysteine desulfurase